MSALKTYVVEFLNKSEHVIRSKCFLFFFGFFGFLSNVFGILALHTKRKRCGHMEPTPCCLQRQVVSVYQVLDLYLLFFFLANVPFLAFLNAERGMAT